MVRDGLCHGIEEILTTVVLRCEWCRHGAMKKLEDVHIGVAAAEESVLRKVGRPRTRRIHLSVRCEVRASVGARRR